MNREQNMSISSTREYLQFIVDFRKSPTKQMLEMLKVEVEKRTAIRQIVDHQQVG